MYCFTSVRPSKIFFVAFFSETIDGRNLIFGHKLHIGIVGSVFEPVRFLLPVCRLSWVFIHIEHICGGIISEHQLTVHLVVSR